MSLTYVTAFIDVYEERANVKSLDSCIEHFKRLVSSGISIHVFLCESFYAKYKDVLPHSPNIHVELVKYTDLQAYKELDGLTYTLPAIRTSHKDTVKYMIVINSKVEFVQRAMDANIFGTSHYAWIDFSICHVLKNWNSSCKFLQLMSATTLQDTCLLIPGCWSKGADESHLFMRINWRFCGGFFVGDRTSLTEMYNLYRAHFQNMVILQGILPWETNVWHYLELYHNWKLQWVSADHNDSIIRIPFHTFKTSACLTTILPITDDCCKTVTSLLPQCDTVFICVPCEEDIQIELPDCLQNPSIHIVKSKDYGSATKYLGALAEIPANSWVFFGDTTYEYSDNLMERMSHVIDSVAVYQNNYRDILQTTSGGLIQSTTGHFIHTSLLHNLSQFPIPTCAYSTADQWLSIYCFKHTIHIHSTNIDSKNDIFKHQEECNEIVLQNDLQQHTIKELCDFFKVRFCHEEGLPDLLTNVL
jgi:hypothetical protein